MNGILNFMWGLRKMEKIDKSVLFLCKDPYTDQWCKKAWGYIKEHFKYAFYSSAKWGDKLTDKAINQWGQFDYIISYLYPCVLPQKALDHAIEHAINFHPAPPKYPGIGGYNYAIWNGDEDYGVMVHEMAEQVDSGQIYNVIYFSMDEDATVKSLKEESMCMLFGLFKDTMIDIEKDGRIYQTVEEEDTKWATLPYTRETFQKNCEIIPRDSNQAKHIARKVRAFYFPGARDGPYFLINGKKYKVIPIDD